MKKKEAHFSAVLGRNRVVIERVKPEIDDGLYPIKRAPEEKVVVEVDLLHEGHDEIRGRLLYKKAGAKQWSFAPLKPLGNDRWQGEFFVGGPGQYFYTIQGWVDAFLTWRRDLQKRVAANQVAKIDLRIGADLVGQAAQHAGAKKGGDLKRWAVLLADHDVEPEEKLELAFSKKLAEAMDKLGEKQFVTSYEKQLEVRVERERANFSAWYEFFPRSCSQAPGKHGTFKDCEAHLAYVAEMGFDIVYLPPIHPIGNKFRKGKNNSLQAEPDDVGCPWAIGSNEGGHDAIHPQLGTLMDFKRFLRSAKQRGIEVALDLAFQCSPDHPYVKEHPEWFKKRPDGTIQYAENPPKKYQDIYPFNFETEAWESLWQELRRVVFYWIKQGVTVFRVDNPHTKPFRFWEWLLAEVRKAHPEIIFLSEAFTRPKIMYRLAKIGFTQSYTYFSWRNTREELTTYLEELTRTEVVNYFRPNFWPNTPDILTEPFQRHGRPMFVSRFILAATLSANYGIYGPAYELGENLPREPHSEEYLDSEKYQIRHWNLKRSDSLKPLISRVNWIRKENSAFHSNRSLQFHFIDNPQLIAYSKRAEKTNNTMVTIVNLDPHHTQGGWVELPLESWGISHDAHFQVKDWLTDKIYYWRGIRNFVQLNPETLSAHIFQILR
ncbi:MAG: alpha-1,4-glucan--maltose-1-phosphate maltosyltransferase [Verrucomicrobiae bacterium]|nr:alpha-1,4-glucan--maltose-1-phosphate maltosyltransferase [Verrucomicrobiae bacterium]